MGRRQSRTTSRDYLLEGAKIDTNGGMNVR
jgi:hypothetical protein